MQSTFEAMIRACGQAGAMDKLFSVLDEATATCGEDPVFAGSVHRVALSAVRLCSQPLGPCASLEHLVEHLYRAYDSAMWRTGHTGFRFSETIRCIRKPSDAKEKATGESFPKVGSDDGASSMVRRQHSPSINMAWPRGSVVAHLVPLAGTAHLHTYSTTCSCTVHHDDTN